MIFFSSFPWSKFTRYQNEIILEQYPNHEKLNPKKLNFYANHVSLYLLYSHIYVRNIFLSWTLWIASEDIKHLTFLTAVNFNEDSIILVCFWSSSSSYFVCLRYPPPIFMKPQFYYPTSSLFCKLVSRFPYTQPLQSRYMVCMKYENQQKCRYLHHSFHQITLKEWSTTVLSLLQVMILEY